MKNKFAKIFLIIILSAGVLFILVELLKEETFTITEKDTDTFIWIESNKLLNSTYKRASLNLEDAVITNADGEEIDYRELVIGSEITAVFKPIILFTDPPGLSAREVKLLIEGGI
ncbi:hypothetical protein [Oceanobacillus sp. CAU 1775]